MKMLFLIGRSFQSFSLAGLACGSIAVSVRLDVEGHGIVAFEAVTGSVLPT